MKKAGIDFGLTNVKAYWIDDRSGERFLSSAEVGRKGVAAALAVSGVTDLCASGNGPAEGFEPFPIHRLQGNPLTLEIGTQSNGAEHLLRAQGVRFARRHMVVSIGTGASYALRDDDVYVPLLGSAVGAGTVDGLLASAGLPSGPGIDEAFGDGAFPNFDLMLAEAVPALKGTPYEAFVASHFAKAARNPPADQDECDRRFAASAINPMVVDVARSLLLHDKNPDVGGTPEHPAGYTDVVVLGTMPARSRVVRRSLETCLRLIGKNPIFPERGEYALAVGAYLDIDP